MMRIRHLPPIPAAVCLTLVLALNACDSSTEPRRSYPQDGAYALIGATQLSPGTSQWSNVPFEYRITSDTSCVFKLLGGSIEISHRSYTAELQQDAVGCPSTTTPLQRETGGLALVYNGNDFTGEFAFVADSTKGWLQYARVDESDFVVALVPPVDSGVVHWLRFRRQ